MALKLRNHAEDSEASPGELNRKALEILRLVQDDEEGTFFAVHKADQVQPE
jgi:hypothetical protein